MIPALRPSGKREDTWTVSMYPVVAEEGEGGVHGVEHRGSLRQWRVLCDTVDTGFCEWDRADRNAQHPE